MGFVGYVMDKAINAIARPGKKVFSKIIWSR